MPFTELKELITIISNKKIPDTTALGSTRIDTKDARYRLFDGIRSERYTTQEQAAKEIFGGSPRDNVYKLTKSRLKQQLMSAIVGYDNTKDKGMSALQRAVYDSVRGVYEVRLLMNNGALHVSRALAERILNLAIKHDVTEPAMQLSRMLRSLYVYLGDKKKADEYAGLHREYLARFTAEDRSEEIVDDIALLASGTTGDLHEYSQELSSMSQEMFVLRRAQPTFLVTTNYFRVQCLTLHIKRKHAEAAQHGLDAIQYLEDHPQFTSRNRIAEFALLVMTEYFSLGDFIKAEQLALRCFENYVPLSNQWYNFLSLYFVLIMQSGDYKKSMSVFRKAAVSALSVQPKANQERWKLYAGYLLYLHEAEFVRYTKSEVELLRRNFDRKKFSFVFNYDLEVYAKDKTGMRISVLILELLFALEDGSMQNVLALQEKLRLIYYRVLKQESYPRANAFFHLIQILMQEDFDTARVRKRGARDVSVLRSSSTRSTSKKIPQSNVMEGLEILRYERVWDMILERVDQLRTSGKFR